MKKIIFLFLFLTKLGYSLTLEEAINEALNNNLELKEYERDLSIANLDIKLSKNMYLPEFFVNFSKSYLNDTPYTEIPPLNPFIPPLKFKQMEDNFIDYELGINLPIFLGFKRSYSLKLSNLNYQVKERLLSEERRKIKIKVIESYIQVLQMEALLKVLEKRRLSIQEHYRRAKEFYREGLITNIDVLQTKVKLAQVNREIERLKGKIEVSKSYLNILLNRDINEKLVLEEIKVDIPENIEFKNLLKSALKNRDIIKALNLQEKEFKYMESLEKSDFYPSVILTGKYFYTDRYPYQSPKGNISLSLGMSIKFQGLAPYYRYLKRKEQERKFRYYKKNSVNRIILQVKNAYTKFKVSKVNLKVAEDSLKEAKEYYRKVTEQFKEQLSTTTDVLNAEAYLTKAREEKIIAYYQLILNYLKLKELTGY